MTPSINLDDDLANEAHKLSMTRNASTAPSSSAPAPSRKATDSSKMTAPTHRAPVVVPSMPSSTGTVDTDAWIDRIFSSAEGKPYDRNWISVHNVNEDILKGVPSKHKLDLLVRHGAVVVGDKLRVTYHSSGNPVTIDGEVSLQHASISTITSDPTFPPGPIRLYK